MGEAVVDERLCVSHDNTGICGACFTMCPLRGKAIKQGLHNRPYVNADVCVGCGLCEEVCIVKGDKAIRVISNREWS
jgi:Pyruvate/2-oxoacid:ferredoxin oxidoreductase delta subunit